ncbi:hypothetical protein KM043_003522 [Ampulex compressa]|nr:hypothetical protein KM043_003522 [Ampulex compressa]
MLPVTEAEGKKTEINENPSAHVYSSRIAPVRLGSYAVQQTPNVALEFRSKSSSERLLGESSDRRRAADGPEAFELTQGSKCTLTSNVKEGRHCCAPGHGP